MNQDSIDKLKLDRRLRRRRGWISDQELEQAVAELPDLVDKVRRPEEDDAGGSAQGSPEGTGG